MKPSELRTKPRATAADSGAEASQPARRELSPEQVAAVAAANASSESAYASLQEAGVLSSEMPVGRVRWIHIDRVRANDYNPNSVAHQEMRLLYTSIREDGYCVEQGTPVLCADLTWRPAGTLQPGTEIIAFDEEPVEGARRRRFRTAVVTANGLQQDRLWRVTTTKGEVLCTGDHPWLARPQRGHSRDRTIRWVTTSEMQPGTLVSRPFEPWETERTYEAGWLSGFLDGEGTMAVNVARNGRSVFRLSGYQRPSPTSDLMVEAIRSRVECKVFTVKRSTRSKWHDMVMCRVDRLSEIMRLLGTVRPQRLIEMGGRFWEGYETSTPDSWAEVLSVEEAGAGTVAKLSTSTGTYIADGYLHHNTQPVVAIRDEAAAEELYIIVDGFHRYTTMRRYADIYSATGGYLPVVVIDKPLADRIASTVRHNRARGKHSVSGMGNLVMQMLQEGVSDGEILQRLGMEPQELARLKHVTGYSALFAEHRYTLAQLADTQVRHRADYVREHPDETVPLI